MLLATSLKSTVLVCGSLKNNVLVFIFSFQLLTFSGMESSNTHTRTQTHIIQCVFIPQTVQNRYFLQLKILHSGIQNLTARWFLVLNMDILWVSSEKGCPNNLHIYANYHAGRCQSHKNSLFRCCKVACSSDIVSLATSTTTLYFVVVFFVIFCYKCVSIP